MSEREAEDFSRIPKLAGKPSQWSWPLVAIALGLGCLALTAVAFGAYFLIAPLWGAD